MPFKRHDYPPPVSINNPIIQHSATFSSEDYYTLVNFITMSQYTRQMPTIIRNKGEDNLTATQLTRDNQEHYGL